MAQQTWTRYSAFFWHIVRFVTSKYSTTPEKFLRFEIFAMFGTVQGSQDARTKYSGAVIGEGEMSDDLSLVCQ